MTWEQGLRGEIGVIVAVVVCSMGMLSGSAIGAGEGGTGRGSAAEAPGTAPLSEIVVTATRDETQLKSAPYYVDVMNGDSLCVRNAVRTVPEALKRQTGTLVQKTGHGQGSPYIRGFTGFRNLFLIDGIRLNNSVFRDGPNQYWNTVDALGLSRLESVRGPFSVLYGSDAVGGTINAIPRGAFDMRPDSNWDRRAYLRYSSAEDSIAARGESSAYLADDLALTLGCSVKNFGDLEGGKSVGSQRKTGYDELDWDARLEYFMSDDAWVVLAHQGVDIDDAWRTHKTIYGIDWEGLSVGKELRRSLNQDRRLTYLQWRHQNINGFCDEVHAGVSHHLQKEERDRLRTDDKHDVQGFDVNTIGVFAQFKSPSQLGTLVYGTEYYHDDVDSFKRTYNADGSLKKVSIQGPVGDDATYDTLGVYVQDEIPVFDDLTLIGGCRYDYASADANSVEDPNTGDRIEVSGHWDSVVGSGRFVYNIDRKARFNVFGGVSQGFRAPNLSDLTRLDSARTDEIETPSPNLDPEEFVSYEIGVKSGWDRLSGQLAYFYTDIKDMIVRTPTGRMIDGEHEVTKRNGGDGHLEGVEAQGRCRLVAGFSVIGSFTWMDGKVKTYPTSDPVLVEEPADRLMPLTGSIGLRWENGRRCWVEASCTSAEKADELSTRDRSDTSRIPPGGTPAYTVYDLRTGWNITENMKLSAAIENLADEDYRIHGSGVNEPGRNLVLAANLRF